MIKTERKKERDGRKKGGRERKFVHFNFKRLMYKKNTKIHFVRKWWIKPYGSVLTLSGH